MVQRMVLGRPDIVFLMFLTRIAATTSETKIQTATMAIVIFSSRVGTVSILHHSDQLESIITVVSTQNGIVSLPF